ncbi:monovalent cation/H+ antiporter complex subunit F [Pseudokineococcus lusitanus]|jgi:multicomponent Na+:H+ antiporter subunit F|uniref:Multisubunit sodium/proton antiporter MrpF subunit n=1 Tax=Pseudokineococcus lusitanus TaxID=763993 RepID=A0A3N1GA85_9ACTN|nr:monovalent cation/H+ antiporter complex subunit F [Pseudokineococcus lusitanus]ROP27149.1 multisubunit sodium/proton antiporter MrpF subunit [Pseudokineococcus lusitanus]
MLPTGTLVVALVLGSALLVAALCVVARAVMGPTILDRVVALDVLVVVLVASFGLYAVLTDTTTALPVLVVLSLVGFVGSVSVARFAAKESR